MPETFDLSKAIKEKVEKGIKHYPCDNNRASALGHVCNRYLVYERLNWQDKILPSPERMQLFKLGKILEDQAKKDIEGTEINGETIRIVESESLYEYKEKGEILCRGKIDGKIEYKRELFPVEIKSMQGYQWVKMESAEDFLYSQKHWLRKYLAQLTMYLLLTNSPLGMFFLVNKSNGQYKTIWIELDYEFAETIVKQAQIVNDFVSKKEYPERIEYLDDVCGHCDFATSCLPDIKNQSGLQIIDNEELLGYLTRMDELKPATSEYKKVDEKVKEMIRGKEKILCGDFLITGKEITINKSAQVARVETQWRTKIVNLNVNKLKENAQKEE